MQSWIHVIEWRATVRPDVAALVDDRGTTLSYAELRTALDRRAGGWHWSSRSRSPRTRSSPPWSSRRRRT
jgi:non-ribosomal peptide synthetase component E (peptide arylation enzyme)